MTRALPIVALDVPDSGRALGIVDLLGDQCRFYKIGSELFAAAGPDVVRAVKERGAEVFLDLKFHDIPHTVRGAVASAASLGVRLLTVHASGGPAMLRAAVEAAGPECRILAVTVLTSLDAAALAQCWGKPVPDVAAEVLRLAGLARDAGARDRMQRAGGRNDPRPVRRCVGNAGSRGTACGDSLAGSGPGRDTSPGGGRGRPLCGAGSGRNRCEIATGRHVGCADGLVLSSCPFYC